MGLLVTFMPAPCGAWGFLPRSKGLGLRLGPQVPTATNGLDRSTRSGFGGGLHYFYLPSEWFCLGIETDGFYMKKGSTDVRPGETPGTRFSAIATAALITGRINLVFDRSWTLYLLGGGGVHETRARFQSASGSFQRQDPGLAVVAAGGVETFLAKNISLSFEMRYHEFRLDAGQFGVDAAELLAYQAGLNFWFGVK